MKEKKWELIDGKDVLRGVSFEEGFRAALTRWAKNVLRDEVERIESEREFLNQDNAENR